MDQSQLCTQVVWFDHSFSLYILHALQLFLKLSLALRKRIDNHILLRYNALLILVCCWQDLLCSSQLSPATDDSSKATPHDHQIAGVSDLMGLDTEIQDEVVLLRYIDLYQFIHCQLSWAMYELSVIWWLHTILILYLWYHGWIIIT